MVVTLGIREFASNDRHVFLEVVVRSWTNSHRNEVELVNQFCMVGPRQAVYMVTAVLVHLAYLVSYYLRWQLYSAVPQFPVFWPSEMTSTTFCESSPTVQSRVQSTEYRRPYKSPGGASSGKIFCMGFNGKILGCHNSETVHPIYFKSGIQPN